jgi:hypothetical protein
MLVCPKCHRNAGWISKEAATFVTEIVKRFGRPTKPVVIRNHPTWTRATLDESTPLREQPKD